MHAPRVSLTKLSPAGSVSWTVTSGASLGPWLARCRAKWAVPPGCAGASIATLPSSRSTAGIGTKATVSLASSGWGSTESEMAWTLLSTVLPLLSAASLAWMVMVAVSPGASDERSQRMRRLMTFRKQSPPANVPVGSGASRISGGSASLTITLLATDGPAFVTGIVKVTRPPACGSDGETDLVTCRSLLGGTVMSTLAASLSGTGSALPPVSCTVAVLVAVELAAPSRTRATMVTLATSPGSSVPSWQTAAVVQVPWVLVTSPAEKLGASVSVSCTADAVDGPRLVTSRVNVTSRRAGDVVTSETLVSARSAWATAPPASVALSFDGSTSPPPATSAVLTMVAGAGSATVALTVIGGHDWPAASASERVQVTVWTTVAQLQPVPVALLTDENAAAGKASVTVTVEPSVAMSPALRTPMVKS